MKNKISFNKPKFVLPLILLPFVYGLNYAALKINKDEVVQTDLKTLNQFNTDIPDPVGLKNEKTKLEALKENLYTKRENTGVANIGEEDKRKKIKVEEGSELSRTQILVDSIQKVNDSLRLANQNSKKRIARSPKQTSRTRNNSKRNYGTSTNTRVAKKAKKEPTEKELFVEQMRIIDSIQNPEKYANKQILEANKEPEQNVLKLKKAIAKNSGYFNTITEKKSKKQASAILDQGLTVYDNSRVRIRLLDDIYIGEYLMKKGQYLYGLVSGFSGQRVILTINSALIDDQIVEINVKIYDNDGIEGVYIPDTLFREFVSELGADSATAIGQDGNSLQNRGSRGIGATLTNGISKLTSAFGRASKRNKANLKYNTVVYLVN